MSSWLQDEMPRYKGRFAVQYIHRHWKPSWAWVFVWRPNPHWVNLVVGPLMICFNHTKER